MEEKVVIMNISLHILMNGMKAEENVKQVGQYL